MQLQQSASQTSSTSSSAPQPRPRPPPPPPARPLSKRSEPVAQLGTGLSHLEGEVRNRPTERPARDWALMRARPASRRHLTDRWGPVLSFCPPHTNYLICLRHFTKARESMTNKPQLYTNWNVSPWEGTAVYAYYFMSFGRSLTSQNRCWSENGASFSTPSKRFSLWFLARSKVWHNIVEGVYNPRAFCQCKDIDFKFYVYN